MAKKTVKKVGKKGSKKVTAVKMPMMKKGGFGGMMKGY